MPADDQHLYDSKTRAELATCSYKIRNLAFKNITCLISNFFNFSSFTITSMTNQSLYVLSLCISFCFFNCSPLQFSLLNFSYWFQMNSPVSWDHFELWSCLWESLHSSCAHVFWKLWRTLSRTASHKLLMKADMTRCRTSHYPTCPSAGLCHTDFCNLNSFVPSNVQTLNKTAS